MAIRSRYVHAVIFILFVLLTNLNQVLSTDPRIVGGRPAVEGEFPYQVSLRRSFNDNHFCGGSIITPNHVLTAAHCMYYQWGGLLPPIVVSIVAGQLNLTLNEDTVFRNVSKITIHPNYNKTSMEFDIAILQLTQSLPSDNPLISKVKLAKSYSKNLCMVSGWGIQEFQSLNISESLLAAEVNMINNTKCDEMYGEGTIKDSMLCAYDDSGERDACQGDSGGPLTCNGFQTGIISTGEGCADPEFPGIYASVPFLHDWIHEIIDKPLVTSSSTEMTEQTISEWTSSNYEEVSEGGSKGLNPRTTEIGIVKSTSAFNETKNINLGENSRRPDDDHSGHNSCSPLKFSLTLHGFITFLALWFLKL